MSDILDLRDLAGELENLREAKEDSEDPLDEDDQARLEALEALEKQLNGDLDEYAENEPTMIADSYFVTYAEEFADDLGAIDRNAGWPLNHIDWKAAAEELQQDYQYVTFDGEAYWIRNC